MATNEPSQALVDAVADQDPIDWEAQRAALETADPELVDSLRVISRIGAARRAAPTRDTRSTSRALVFGYGAVVALAAFKLALAAIGTYAVLSTSSAKPVNWPLALNVLLFGFSGALLVIGGTRDRRVQSLGALFLIIASAFCGPLMPQATGSVWGGVVSWTHHLRADAFLAMALWSFAWHFPTDPNHAGARRFAKWFGSVAAGLGVLLFAANAAFDANRWYGSQTTLPLLGAVARAEVTLYWPLLLGMAAPAILFLMWKSRFETPANRGRIGFFVGSLAMGLSPIVLAVLLSPVVPVLRDPSWRGRIGVVLYLALASIVPMTAYAVAVDRVMDLHLVVRKTMQYALARYSVWCASVGPLLVLAFDIYLHRNLTFGGYLGLAHPIGLLTVSLVGFAVLTFRHDILQCVDRWFLRDAADYTEAVARLERGLRTTRSIREISTVLKREIDLALRPTTIAVLLVEEAGGRLVSLESAIPPLLRGSALLEVLRAVRTEVQIGYHAGGAVAGLLPEADRQWLADTGFQLFFPLVGSTGTLLGMVGIGKGRNGLPYTERDGMLITAMSGQAALRLENCRLKEQSGGMTPVPRGAEAPTVDWENEPAMRCPECGIVWKPSTRHCSCGASTVEAALPLVVNGKFRVDRFIGAGGTGVVYLAVDLALDRKVAIKTLPAIRLDRAARLSREARAIANVLHPNLALIYGAEQWKSTPLLIFEYLEGGTLVEPLRRGPVPLDEVIDLGTLLADALDRVHASLILHRDIKPSNIGYTADGVPKLLDFGLAAILDRSRAAGTTPAVVPTDPDLVAELMWGAHPTASLTITQQLVGTPLYLSPEALAGQAPHPSFDLWSLSLVLYEALAGRHPLAGETIVDVIKRIQRGALPDVRDFRPDCPALVAAFLNDALSGVVDRRPATAADLRTRLRWLQTQLFPQAS